MSGAESEFRRRILGIEPHIWVARHGGPFSGYDEVIKKIQGENGVKTVSPYVISQAMVSAELGSSGAYVRGIDPHNPGPLFQGISVADLENKLPDPSGRKSQDEKPGIVLGKELANVIGAKEGDTVLVMSLKGIMSPMGILPRFKPFRVSGTFSSGMYEYDGALGYVHIKDAQKLMRMEGSASRVGVWVDNIYSAGSIAGAIEKKLGFPFWTKDWMTMNNNLFSALKLEKTAMFVILTLIILVAAFNIASSLIMMVNEKTKDIAVLKAMGATDSSIRKIFVVSGLLTGSIGTVIGISGGVALCMFLERFKFQLPPAYPFSSLPIQLEGFDVIVIAVSALVICLVATIYPARQASRLVPVEGIRYG
jgi:lipoprotein-releasing system permease protein